jgi:hypothetical protein
LYVIRRTIWTNILLNVDFIQIVVYYWFFKSSVFLEFKSMVFYLLRFAFFFEFLVLPPLCTSLTPLTHFPRPCARVCVLSMPRQRESLNRVKTRLSPELKNRTERRVRDILCPRTSERGEEIFDDSEEDNRLEGRRLRRSRDKEIQTDTLSSSFCCGVIVGVSVVLCLLICLVLFITDVRQKFEKQR